MPSTGHFYWLLFRKFRDFIAQQLHFGQSIYNNGSSCYRCLRRLTNAFQSIKKMPSTGHLFYWLRYMDCARGGCHGAPRRG